MGGLGDVIEAALSKVGVTKARVEEWIGGPCGCEERQEKLNALGYWAARVLRGKAEGARNFLRGLMGGKEVD